MQLITYINEFILAAIVAVLFFGVVLNIRYVHKDAGRQYFVALLSFWAMIMLSTYLKFKMEGATTISYNRDTISALMLVLGIPSFLSLICFPITLLNVSLIRLGRLMKIMLPIIILAGVYFGYHAIAGIDPFTVYPSYSALFANIGSISVILRLLLAVALIVYIIMSITNIWRLVPVYKKYIHENIADGDCNVDWIKDLLVYIAILSLFYVVMLLFSSPYVNFFYVLSVLALFVYVIDMSLFRYTSEHIKDLKVDWSKEKGWHIVDDDKFEHIEPFNDDQDIMHQVDMWVVKSRPYISVDFTTNDILAEFPSLTQQKMAMLFKERDETFQSYARRCRINLACKIIIESEGDIYPKQLFRKVGFSHYSSFSRAFASVAGQSPTEFITAVKESSMVVK